MTILENLWYGNIRPVEEFVDGNTEYKNLLRRVGNNLEKFEATLSTEQAELFEKYYNAVNEMNSISEAKAFSYGFRLGVRLMIEAVAQNQIT
ncbi:MAG: hypothetical protein IKI29_03025 [Clostridia bacterium]|nr:hypothetical protein [Clostridia bacterium]